MKLNVYSIFSDLSDLFAGDGLFMYHTDKQALYVIGSKIPAEDKANCSLVRVGTFDLETGHISPCTPTGIDWPNSVDDFSKLSSISHEPPEVQSSKFQERISDVR